MPTNRLAFLTATVVATITFTAAGPLRAAPDLKARLAEWEAAFNAHDGQRMAALGTPDVAVVGIKPSGWVEERGPAAARASVEPYFAAFPDVRLAATRVFHDRDRLIVEWVSNGTNKGPFAGAPPTGKK